MNIEHNTSDQAQTILDAMRTIQDSPELKAEAKTNPESLLNRLSLSGIARHAVALGIAGLIVAQTTTPPVAQPAGYWV